MVVSIDAEFVQFLYLSHKSNYLKKMFHQNGVKNRVITNSLHRTYYIAIYVVTTPFHKDCGKIMQFYCFLHSLLDEIVMVLN